MATKKELSNEFCAAVAKLHAAGLSDLQIIAIFKKYSNIKKDVPEARKRAEKLGFLTRPQLNLQACSEQGVSEEQIDALILGGNLAVGFRSRSTSLRSIHVVYPSGSHAEDKFDNQLVEFAPYAAKYIAEVIGRTKSKSNTIGVSWGLTPRVVIDALGKIPVNGNGTRHVFPVCGRPLHKYQGNCGASANAAQLHQILNGDEKEFEYAMPLVSALIPVGAEDIFLELFEKYAIGYKEVFGAGRIGDRSGGLIEDVDMILTSVSKDNALGKLLEADVTEWAKIGSFADVRLRVSGDIAGVLLRKRYEIDTLLDQFDRHWTGLNRNHIENCAQLAIGDKERPGVCVVAIGKNKAKVVLQCLLASHASRKDTGLITQLICDQPLADELKRLAESMNQPIDFPE